MNIAWFEPNRLLLGTRRHQRRFILKYAARYFIGTALFVAPLVLAGVYFARDKQLGIGLAVCIVLGIGTIIGLLGLLNLTNKRNINITQEGLQISQKEMISVEKRVTKGVRSLSVIKKTLTHTSSTATGPALNSFHKAFVLFARFVVGKNRDCSALLPP